MASDSTRSAADKVSPRIEFSTLCSCNNSNSGLATQESQGGTLHSSDDANSINVHPVNNLEVMEAD